MNPKKLDEARVFSSPTGEEVRELGGAVAGNLIQHSIAHITLPPGGKSGKHYHPEAEESYYILSGQAEVELDGKIYHLSAGDLLAILPNLVHQIRNISEVDVSFIAVCAPPWTPECSVFLDD